MKKKHKKIKFKMTTTRIIIVGFLAAIVIGAFLLMLPVASRKGVSTSLIDAVFTATTSVCVTGLTTVTTLDHWSFFGQLVILVLIQFGGLGIITFTTTVLLLLRKRITLGERILIQNAYNLETLSGMVALTKRIIKGTLIVEGIGALIYSIQFIPEFGAPAGIWKSIFHSVSAFCNAGIDLIGEEGFTVYTTNVLVNINTSLLIIIGGIGFPVWWSIVGQIKKVRKGELPRKLFLSKLDLHTKIALTATAFLIASGTILIFLFEYNNSATIADLNFGQKLLASYFQSVTTRTAGFQTIPQENFTEATSFLSLLFMFIGGSPSSTAGGIKTVSVAVIVIAMAAAVKGKDSIEAFGRKIPDSYLRRAVTLFTLNFLFLVVLSVALFFSEGEDFLSTLYETISATATVGLTRGMTPKLSTAGKIFIICGMYAGRVGTITMALAFNSKKYSGKKTLPEAKVIIG